jgi:hypothetical protein
MVGRDGEVVKRRMPSQHILQVMSRVLRVREQAPPSSSMTPFDEITFNHMQSECNHMAPQAIAIRREAESRVGYVQGPRPHEPISDLASHVSGRRYPDTV